MGSNNVFTLPEITIEGDPTALPANASDWWAQGFTTGYNAPHAAAERPPMIKDELVAVYLVGFASGQQAARDTQADFDERFRGLPQIGPDLGGESFAEAQRRYNEAWEAVLHEHMPHTEVEVEPGPPPVRPNIVRK